MAGSTRVADLVDGPAVAGRRGKQGPFRLPSKLDLWAPIMKRRMAFAFEPAGAWAAVSRSAWAYRARAASVCGRAFGSRHIQVRRGAVRD